MSRLRWHPKTGEVKQFEDNEQHPADWLDYHPDDVAKREELADDTGGSGTDPNRLSKKEVIDALTEAGVPFNARDNLATLTDLLDKTVAEVFVRNGQTAPAGVTLRERLDMVRGD